MFFSILCFHLNNPICFDHTVIINFTVFSSLSTISSSEYSCAIPGLLTDLLKHHLLPIVLCPIKHSYISPILFTHCVFFTVKYSPSKFANLLTIETLCPKQASHSFKIPRNICPFNSGKLFPLYLWEPLSPFNSGNLFPFLTLETSFPFNYGNLFPLFCNQHQISSVSIIL